MAETISKAQLTDFLDFLGKKGLMNAATVAARKAATNTMLGILSEEEAADVSDIDLEDLSRRFLNLKGNNFKPESVRVYKSRLSGTLGDYKSYKKDPLKFRPSLTVKAPPSPRQDKPESTNPREQRPQVDSNNEVAFPIPIRPDKVVRLVGVPSDLTKREAAKIANVIMALAQNSEVESE
jgi:site-specific recombinase XerC